MFDLGWSEMAIIMLVALIVIGPRDLPRAARTLGRWSAKGRSLMREFQRSIDDMAREAELDDIKKEVEKAGRTDIRKSIERTIDPDGKLKSAFDVNEKKLPKKATKAEKLDVAKADARTDTQADDKLDAKANGSDKKPFNEDAALSDAEHDEVFEPIPELDKETVKKEPETVAPSNKD